MTDKVAICNKALGWLGQDPITSFEDKNNKAILCKQNYDSLRDAVISERMWTFAQFRAVSESNTMDAWEKQFVHPFQEGWLQVFRCFYDVTSRSKNLQSNNWSVEGREVLTDDVKIYVWGVKRITDNNKFSPLFVECLAARIAADLCIPITENQKLQADLWALYQAKLTIAAVRDGQQGRAEQTDSTRLINARAR